MTPDICIYHANCMDGFTAAWVVKRRFPNVELRPASYGEEPPLDVEGKHILIVDFSYSAHQLRRMVLSSTPAASVTVLDHHKSAEEALREFEAGELTWVDLDLDRQTIAAHFDMEKSGARLAWEFCFGNAAVHPIVAYTEDRDLWRWRLPGSNNINAALGSHDQSLEEWDRLSAAFLDPELLASLATEGMAIRRQQAKDVERAIATSKREMRIGGHLVEVANVPFYLASDAGAVMSAWKPFSATYYDAPDGRIFSLRSKAGGEHSLDVSEIARKYGGGGHKHAAGFKMPRGWEGDGTVDIVERCARLLENRRDRIVAENGDYEPDTNATNLPDWAESVCEELDNAATEIRAIGGAN